MPGILVPHEAAAIAGRDPALAAAVLWMYDHAQRLGWGAFDAPDSWFMCLGLSKRKASGLVSSLESSGCLVVLNHGNHHSPRRIQISDPQVGQMAIHNLNHNLNHQNPPTTVVVDERDPLPEPPSEPLARADGASSLSSKDLERSPLPTVEELPRAGTREGQRFIALVRRWSSAEAPPKRRWTPEWERDLAWWAERCLPIEVDHLSALESIDNWLEAQARDAKKGRKSKFWTAGGWKNGILGWLKRDLRRNPTPWTSDKRNTGDDLLSYVQSLKEPEDGDEKRADRGDDPATGAYSAGFSGHPGEGRDRVEDLGGQVFDLHSWRGVSSRTLGA